MYLCVFMNCFNIIFRIIYVFSSINHRKNKGNFAELQHFFPQEPQKILPLNLKAVAKS